MIKREDVLFIPYFEKTEYTGSHEGMRYRMEKKETKQEIIDENNEKVEKKTKTLLVTVWPEPFNYFNTPEEQKIRSEFSFDEDGIVDAVAWMNERLFYDKEKWQDSARNWDSYDKIHNQ